MINKKEPKSWHTCMECGDKFYPNTDKSNWYGITCSMGTCPDCGKEDITLIPIDDFKYYNTPFFD